MRSLPPAVLTFDVAAASCVADMALARSALVDMMERRAVDGNGERRWMLRRWNGRNRLVGTGEANFVSVFWFGATFCVKTDKSQACLLPDEYS